MLQLLPIRLSAGYSVRKGGRFRNIVDWVVIIEFDYGLLHTFRDVLAARYSLVKVGLDCVVSVSVEPVVTMVTTGSKFPSLYDSIRQIPQRHDTNLCPAPLVVIFQACNLWQISDKDI